MVITLGETHYAAWTHLLESVKTGMAGFPLMFGAEMFDYLGQDVVLLSYDFSATRSLVDVGGGGCGRLLTSILHMYPSM
jgi:hypothetical protein